MSIFGAIRDAIFGGPAAAAPVAAAQPAPATSSEPDTATATAAASQPTATPVDAARVEVAKVDVAAILDKLNKQRPEKLDWRHSIVDLMKLLDLESSLGARRELANELGYEGDTRKSAEMNIWLHKQVMTKLTEHGGVVPDELKS
jgi:3-oxoacyl-ACP reductase-like protein